MDSNKVSLCYPNRVEQSFLSGGSWVMSLPLDNLKNKVFAKRARTTNLDLTSTQFSVALDKLRAVGVVSVASHNLSSNAMWRIVLYSDSEMTVMNHDSGFINVWAGFYQPEQLEWEDNNFWFGDAVLDVQSDYTPLATYFLPDNISCRAIKIEFSDPLNSSGYVELGRLFFSEVFQPKINAQYGISFSHEVQTTTEETLDGTVYFDRKRPKRTCTFTLGSLDQTEAFLRLYSIQRDQGIDREILFAQETQDSDAFYFRTFIGRLVQVDPISQPFFDRFSGSINLKEII